MVGETLSPPYRPDSDRSQHHVGQAAKAECFAALKLVFCDLVPETQARTLKALLSAAARGEISFDGLLVARQGGQLRGAVWARVNAGRQASVWPPRVCGDESEETVLRLLDALDGFLRQRSVRLAQALVEPADTEGASRLEAGGYRGSTDLIYLACPRDQAPAQRPASPLEFEPFAPDQPQRLSAVVERTYAGTYDFPELNEVCEAEQVLAGYRETGIYTPQKWFFVRESGRDIGCLLLADHPHERQLELLYMGVVPEARGQSMGTAITRHALWLTAQAGRQQIVLGVDAANEPALRMYARAGFTQWDRRRVFLKLFDGKQSDFSNNLT
jgi:ribosomal protein S18 acetylase RimI-like enzyme